MRRWCVGGASVVRRWCVGGALVVRRWCVGGASVALFGPYLCKSMLNLPFPHLSVINLSFKIPRQIHCLVCSLCCWRAMRRGIIISFKQVSRKTGV